MILADSSSEEQSSKIDFAANICDSLQIYDLESRYLENSHPLGSAIKGA